MTNPPFVTLHYAAAAAGWTINPLTPTVAIWVQL